MTHSHSGGFGWRAAIQNRNIRAIVSYEPGSGFIFPEGEVPPPMPSSAGPLEAVSVPLAEFMLMTKIPIVVYYGDNIPMQPSANPGQDNWRVRLAMVKLWAPRLSVDTIHQCLLLHGHYGYTDELPFEQRMRDVMGLEIGDGAAAIMKIVVARELIGRESLPY